MQIIINITSFKTRELNRKLETKKVVRLFNYLEEEKLNGLELQNKSFPGNMLLKSIHPRQGSKTDQSMDTTKLQLGELVSFLGDT